MSFAGFVKSRRSSDRSSGRRHDDHAAGKERERRRPPSQTQASAQSVVMAYLLSPTPKPPIAQAIHAYARSKPQKTPEDIKREAFLRDAELQHQAAQKAWAFERRTGKKPRSPDIEYAEFVDL